jgi:trans-aconitate methyltransferase
VGVPFCSMFKINDFGCGTGYQEKPVLKREKFPAWLVHSLSIDKA